MPCRNCHGGTIPPGWWRCAPPSGSWTAPGTRPTWPRSICRYPAWRPSCGRSASPESRSRRATSAAGCRRDSRFAILCLSRSGRSSSSRGFIAGEVSSSRSRPNAVRPHPLPRPWSPWPDSCDPGEPPRVLREGKGWGEERSVPFSLLLTIARGRGGRTRRGLLELLDGDFVDRPAAGAVDVVVLPPLDPRRLQSEIDLFPAQGEAPATAITAKLHIEIPFSGGRTNGLHCTREPRPEAPLDRDFRPTGFPLTFFTI